VGAGEAKETGPPHLPSLQLSIMMGKEAFLNSPMIVYLVKMTIRSGTPRCGACLMPKAKTKPNLHRLPYPLCKFVLSTSPQRELVNDFQKPPVPEVFYMPLWTEAEMENVASTRVPKAIELA
jgi:hypothetical protein